MNAITETLNAWGERGIAFAPPMLLQSSLLIVFLFVLDWILRKRVSAGFRSALWLLLLVKLVLPPSLALPTSIGYWIGRPQVQSPTPKTVTQVRVTYRENAMPAPVAPTSPTPAPVTPMSFAGWLALGWLAGSTVLLAFLLQRGRLVANLLRHAEPATAELQRLLDDCRQQLGLRSSVELRISPHAISPALCGLFKPGILLPHPLVGRLNPTQLRALLLHELMHLRRRDLWVNHAQVLLQIAYWWHPLLWLANARIRRVREEAVDEAVMAVLHPDNEVYPETLLEVAKACLTRPRLSLGLVGIIESRSALRQRIELALNRIGIPQERLRLSGLAALVLIAAVALPMGCKAPTTMNQARLGSTRRLAATFDPSDLSQGPPEASIRASAPDTPFSAFSDAEGRVKGRGATLKQMVSSAYNVTDSEIIWNTAPPDGRFDYLIRLPQDNRKIFQKLLYEQFGLVTGFVQRNTEVIVVRVKTPDSPGLRPVTAPGHQSSTWGWYQYQSTQTTIKDMLHSLGVYNERIMVDETGLTNFYAINIKWGSPENRGFDFGAFQKVMERELGLEASLIKRPHSMMLVQQVDATGHLVSPSSKVEEHQEPSARQRVDVSVDRPQITIESRFMELPAPMLADLQLGAATGTWSNGSSIRLERGKSVTENTNTLSYWVLSPQRTDELIHRLEHQDGTNVLSARVTTLDGRQARLVAADILTTEGFLAANSREHGPAFPKTTIGPKTKFVRVGPDGDSLGPGMRLKVDGLDQVAFGPQLDILPRITKDQTAIDMTLIASVKEFLGYAPSNKTPIPQIRTQQLLTSVTVKDGETVILAGEAPANAPKDAKALIVLVTPTLIDAAGNKIHE